VNGTKIPTVSFLFLSEQLISLLPELLIGAGEEFRLTFGTRA
jgi:hypothetical protein